MTKDLQATWQQGVESEVAFWDQYFATKGLQWPDDYQARLDPQRLIDDHAKSYIDAPGGSTISILDVGAGPLTCLGRVWANRHVEITAVDPLADLYDSILTRHGITPPVRTRRCAVESLTSLFAHNQFDLVHMRNALDHAIDPAVGIQQMIAVCKQGSYILLNHFVNEAEEERYQGLHQWNLTVQEGEFVAWNPSTRISLSSLVADQADVKTRLEDRWVTVSLRKRFGPVSHPTHATQRLSVRFTRHS